MCLQGSAYVWGEWKHRRDGMCMHARSLQLSPTLRKPWTVASQAPSLSVGLFRQEYWSGLP